MTLYYTTTGNVRGCCGHRHRTIDAAYACLKKDQRYCKKIGGYSDRKVAGPKGRTLTDDERTELEYIEYKEE